MEKHERLARYLGAQSALGPRWQRAEPDRPATGRLAFVWNATGSFQVYTIEVRADGRVGWPRQISSGERGTSPEWLPDGSLIYSRDIGGNECFQLMRAASDGEVEQQTVDSAAKHRLLHVHEGRMLVASNESDRSRFSLYSQPAVDAEWSPRCIYTPESGVITQAKPIPGGGTIALTIAESLVHQRIVLVHPDDRAPEVTELTAGVEADGRRWSIIRVCNDGLLVATDAGSDLLRAAILRLDGTLEEIGDWSTAFGEPTDSASSVGHDVTYLTTTCEGFARLFALDHPRSAESVGTAVSEVHEIELPFPAVMVAGDNRTSQVGLDLSSDGARLAIALSASDRTTNIYLLDIRSGSWSQLTRAGAPGLGTQRFVPSSSHRFTSFDTESVPYFRSLPKGKPPYPGVLLIHGGPEAQFTPAFNPVVQFLVAQGLAVIAPNIRGSAGYGRRYMDLDNREKRLDAIRDIAELATYLDREDEQIDGSRLAVFGGSYGGFAVLSAMTEYPHLWRAGVDIVGISNFVTFLKNTAEWRRALREAEYGSLEELQLLERISPINRIERLTAPLMIIQGDNDERVPLSESIQIYERLTELGRTVELLRFADEGHGVTKLPNRIIAYSRAAEWLAAHL